MLAHSLHLRKEVLADCHAGMKTKQVAERCRVKALAVRPLSL